MTYEKNRSEFLEALSGAAVARKDRQDREVRIRGRIAVVSVLVGITAGAVLTGFGIMENRRGGEYYDQRLMAVLEQHYSLFGEYTQPIVQNGWVCSADVGTLPEPSGKRTRLPVRGQRL